MHRRIPAVATTAIAAAIIAASGATWANAATPQCTAVLGNACGSWNAEVPGLPDLDVLGGAAVSGNAIIVFTRTSHDKAEDFAVQPVAAGSTSTFPAVHAAVSPANAVRIQYTPDGLATGLCVSTVNPNGNTAVQLRACDNTAGTYNPFQTFVKADANGDGQFVSFTEVINNMKLTDPRNSGSIGVVGHRVHVLVKAADGTSGQLWGQNGA